MIKYAKQAAYDELPHLELRCLQIKPFNSGSL